MGESRFYLELFAVGGIYTCKDTECLIDGSELRALKDNFEKCIFIVNDVKGARNLKKLIAPIKAEGTIVIGNCINDKTLRLAFNLIPRSGSSLAFIDPPGYSKLRWSTMKKLASHGMDWEGHKMDLRSIL